MKKIRIHRFNNEQWGRAHLPFFKTFDEYLKKYFDVEVINYNKDGNTFSGHINTLKNVGTFGKNPPLSDVDCVIENLQTGDLKVLSVGEYFSNFVSHYAKSKVCSKVLLSHFNWHNLYYWMKREGATNEMYKVKPWIFLPYAEFDYLHYRNKKETSNELNNKMYWQGSGVDDYRQCVRFLEQDGYLQPITPMNHDIYLEKMSMSKIGMSYYQKMDRYRTPFDYPGEFCYREIEYMSIGLPFIRIEYKDSVHDPLLPNVHYISIPRDVANVEFEKNGERGIADLYIQRYNEVINDEEFLLYISKNQKEWFDRNVLSPNREKLTFDLLEIKEWLKVPDNYIDNEIINIENNETKKDYTNEELFIEFLKFLDLKKEVKIETVETVTSETIKQFDKNSYKGYVLQQAEKVFEVFKSFISEIKPKRILEIGTAGGGLTLFLRDCLDEIGLNDSTIKSFEVLDSGYYDELRIKNIEIRIENIFDSTYTKLINVQEIEDYIKGDGTTLVLCDGGNKVSEFNILSKFLKPGDFIMAHDYCHDLNHFETEINNKIWLWCEIMESNIEQISKEQNLVHYNQDNFNKIVWVCKKKEINNTNKKNDILLDAEFKNICEQINDCFFIK